MDDKQVSLITSVKRLRQLQEFYCSMADALNTDSDQTVFTKHQMKRLCKGYSTLVRSIQEEEKVTEKLLKLVEDDVYARKPKESSHVKKTGLSGRNFSVFQSLLDTSEITVNEHIIAKIDGSWIEVTVLNKDEDNFYVLDSDILPDGPETTVSVERNSVIRMPIALKITPLDVHAYIIPPEHKVLALWPGTTTYYEGIVLTREGAKDDEMVVKFTEGEEILILPYTSVVPYRDLE